MRRPGWMPSIVPQGDDQNVYLVVDDLGRNGRAYRETVIERTDREAVISTPAKVGRRMCRQTSKSCDAAAICKCATCRITFMSSSSDTTASTGS